ncbi:hypothetical protein KGV52_00800 [Candidatus Gracilibacteria bacterium]|nr:hypothetical protein [Candidatus Gracilibacteria bacterium]
MSENKEKIETIDFTDTKSTSKNKENKTKGNIFDDFNTDTSLKEDVKKMKAAQERDTFFYLSILGKLLQVVFFLLLFASIFLYAYVYVQKSETMESQSYLDPVCNLLVGDVSIPSGSCSSIAFLQKDFNSQLKTVQKKQARQVIEMLPKVYESENFLQGKEVKFLSNTSKHKLKVLEILARFDMLKNDFLGVDRKKLICANFEIDAQENILKAKCKAFTQGFSRVVGFEGEKNIKNVSGTSISLANSFLNYIQKNSSDFTIIDRQKIFSIDKEESQDGYTNSTSFDLTLKINF